MWLRLPLLLTLCLLHGGGAESDGGGPRCQLAPSWKIGEVEPMKGTTGRVTVVALLQASWLFCLVQAGRMDGLHQRLESQGFKDVAYMVVNHQGVEAQHAHGMLEARLSENITLYKQDEQQTDVWQTLNGDKDDFFIYDRCGRLTHRVSLPYSIIGHGHIERAIKDTYCKRICGDCTHESAETPEECSRTVQPQPDADGSPAEAGPDHDRHHGHHHGHHFHPRGSGHGHHHHHGHHHRGHRHHHGGGDDVAGQNPDQGQGQSYSRLDGQQSAALDVIQQVVQLQFRAQEAQGGQGGQGAAARPWDQTRVRWKAKYSWQSSVGSDAQTSSWCWHWRRLFDSTGGQQAVGLWHCDEALPASWRWHGLIGDATDNSVRETWQWRSPLVDWQQSQPAPWAWPAGVVSWGWEQL